MMFFAQVLGLVHARGHRYVTWCGDDEEGGAQAATSVGWFIVAVADAVVDAIAREQLLGAPARMCGMMFAATIPLYIAVHICIHYMIPVLVRTRALRLCAQCAAHLMSTYY